MQPGGCIATGRLRENDDPRRQPAPLRHRARRRGGAGGELTADGAETETVRFYQGIMHFAGERTGPGEANGTWTCAPLDLDQGGWLDTAVVAPGSWTITTADD